RLARGRGDGCQPRPVQGRAGSVVRRGVDPLRARRRDLRELAASGGRQPAAPGGYHGYQALFGAKYIAPAIGGGPNHTHHGFPVTDANGNLVDLDGATLEEPFTHTPGF